MMLKAKQLEVIAVDAQHVYRMKVFKQHQAPGSIFHALNLSNR